MQCNLSFSRVMFIRPKAAAGRGHPGLAPQHAAACCWLHLSRCPPMATAAQLFNVQPHMCRLAAASKFST